MSALSPVDYTQLITDALNDLDLPRAQQIWAEMREEWPIAAERIAAKALAAGQRGLDARAEAEQQFPSTTDAVRVE